MKKKRLHMAISVAVMVVEIEFVELIVLLRFPIAVVVLIVLRCLVEYVVLCMFHLLCVQCAAAFSQCFRIPPLPPPLHVMCVRR